MSKSKSKGKGGRPKWDKWNVELRFDSRADAEAFAQHVRDTGVVYVPAGAEWPTLRAEAVGGVRLDPRGAQLAQHQHYLDGERAK